MNRCKPGNPLPFKTCMRTSRFTMYVFFHNWYLQPWCSLIKRRNGDYESHLTSVYVKFRRNFHFFHLRPYVSSGPSIWRPGSSSQSLPCEGGAVESSSTRYWEWYNGLCIWSRLCLGCREVIRWHVNRQSAFFAVALVLICRIKTQPVRHWTHSLYCRASLTARELCTHPWVQAGMCLSAFTVGIHQSSD